MSRRGGADRAAENQQTIKNLLKLDGNKVCADCKQNKHPRWASWSIGVFICIRCSGIHRGMGTHISRVKSVDLDAWTDEQLQSVLKWGNSRANKYWEAKLAAGHVPSEAKIENFIRTKYESKRWVMDGQTPDPSSLDADGDDDVPLNLVQEKAKIERSASEKKKSTPSQLQSQRRAAPNIDLFGDEMSDQTLRPSSTDNTANSMQTRSAGAPSTRPSKQGDSLLGLDLFGSVPPSGPPRPASASSPPTDSPSLSRPDLKQSILSLYSSAPKTQVPSHHSQPSVGSSSVQPMQAQDAFGGLADSLNGLKFSSSNGNTSASKQVHPDLSGTNMSITSVGTKSGPSAPQVAAPAPLSGGSFFSHPQPKETELPKPQVVQPRKLSKDLDWNLNPSSQPGTTSISASKDFFADDDFTGFAQPAPPPAQTTSSLPPSSTSANFNSAFNLSARPTSNLKAPTTPKSSNSAVQSSAAALNPWSSANDSSAWSAAEQDTAPSRPKGPIVDIGRPPTHLTPSDISRGWAEPDSTAQKPVQAPSIVADEDYGGWASSSTREDSTAPPPKPSGGFGGTTDPFDNPWG